MRNVMKPLCVALVIGASTSLAGCTNMEEMPGPIGNPSKVCTKEYVPVCGAKGYKRKSFGNACEANAAGYSVVKEGKCGG